MEQMVSMVRPLDRDNFELHKVGGIFGQMIEIWHLAFPVAWSSFHLVTLQLPVCCVLGGGTPRLLRKSRGLQGKSGTSGSWAGAFGPEHFDWSTRRQVVYGYQAYAILFYC